MAADRARQCAATARQRLVLAETARQQAVLARKAGWTGQALTLALVGFARTRVLRRGNGEKIGVESAAVPGGVSGGTGPRGGSVR